MDGEALLRLVKSDLRWQRIPFIVVTGEAAAACRVLEAGADDFLDEPFGPQELRARVTAAIRTHRMVRELESSHGELVRIHSESKRLELELHQAQKLEAVGRLAAGIAHEINTPIQFIGDNARFLGTSLAALARMLGRQREALAGADLPAAERQALAALEEELDLAFVLEQAGRRCSGPRRASSGSPPSSRRSRSSPTPTRRRWCPPTSTGRCWPPWRWPATSTSTWPTW